jgi:hypothetical protein
MLLVPVPQLSGAGWHVTNASDTLQIQHCVSLCPPTDINCSLSHSQFAVDGESIGLAFPELAALNNNLSPGVLHLLSY